MNKNQKIALLGVLGVGFYLMQGEVSGETLPEIPAGDDPDITYFTWQGNKYIVGKDGYLYMLDGMPAYYNGERARISRFTGGSYFKTGKKIKIVPSRPKEDVIV